MDLIRRKIFLTLFVAVVVLAAVLIPLPSASAPLIANHTSVEKYADIPQAWINEVKKMWLNVPGESHSSGYRNGLELLKNLDSRFQANRTEDGTPPESYTDQHLRVSGHLWSGSGWWNYGAGEANWYTNAAGIAGMKAHLTYSNTNRLAIAAMGFGWCWDMSWHNAPGGGIDPVYQVRWAGASEGGPQGDLRWGLDSEDQSLTGNSVSMDTYLNATQQYSDYSKANNYPTKVFFTTGPVDSYTSGESGYQLHLKQERIRNYVIANDGLLFDDADILTWGDDGTQPTNNWTDYGGTLRVFPTIHPDNMKDLNGGYTEDGDHIGQRGAVRLAKAMWWMLARIAGWDGVPGGGDTIFPTVSSTTPANGATNNNPATAVSATFSEAVTASTVNATTFTLKAGSSSVPGTVTLAGTTATFQPSASLANSTTYTAIITTGVTDLAGNAMAANYTWSFTTAAAPDTTPPAVTSVTPAAGATGVASNTSVTAAFSEAIDPLTVTTATFTLKNGASTVSGAVSASGVNATFTPGAPLTYGTTFTAALTTGIRDLAGNTLASLYSWTFTTGAAPDITPPTVTGTTPAANTTSVPVNTTVTATFSEPVDLSTVSTASFTLKDGNGAPVTGAVSLAGTVTTFTPSSVLAGSATYTAAITTAVKDLAGNPIASPFSWSFATASLSPVDSDGDGVPDATDAFPNDPTRATFPTTSGTGNVTVDASGNGPAVLRNVCAIADTDPSLNNYGKPSGFVFPDGLVSFDVRGIAPGSTVTVRITFPAPLPSGARIYKVTSSGYNEFPGAVISGKTVTLTLTDGGSGDSDGAANGIISDPTGVAAPAPGTASSSGGGGCSVTPGSDDPGDFSGVFGVLGYSTMVFFLWPRRKGKRV
jgi:hypothetical protein